MEFKHFFVFFAGIFSVFVSAMKLIENDKLKKENRILKKKVGNGMREETKRLNDLIDKYSHREITRQQIIDITGMTSSNILTALRKRGVEVWDPLIKSHRDIFPQLREMYNRREMNRAEISKKFGINPQNFKRSLILHNIELWDDDEEFHNRDYPGEFHNPGKDNSPYAQIFYKYND